MSLARKDIDAIFAAQKKLLTARPAGYMARAAGALNSKAYQKSLKSLAHSCHPDQVDEFNRMAKEAGTTGVHYAADGTCEFSSRGQRKAWNKYRGTHDADGGYGDG